MKIWLIGYILLNFIPFCLVMLDKRFARHKQRRIRERTFFLWALLLGAAGVLAGMYVFRHKTRHWSFIIGIPLLILLNIGCLYFWHSQGL